jgi:hypothetical protein
MIQATTEDRTAIRRVTALDAVRADRAAFALERVSH